MPQLPYPAYEDRYFSAAGKPTINVMKMLSYSPATIEHWSAIGNAHFTRIALPKKLRELVILLSAAKFGSSYEWTHHVPLSAKFGITTEQRNELMKAGRTKGYFADEYWSTNVQANFDQKEKLLLQFLEAVIDAGKVNETTWQKTAQEFSPREIVEIVSLQGFYYTLGRITTVLKVDPDDFAKPKL